MPAFTMNKIDIQITYFYRLRIMHYDSFYTKPPIQYIVLYSTQYKKLLP